MTLHINSQFDSGNIELINTQSNPIELAIRHDNQSSFYQWFHFSITGAKDKSALELRMHQVQLFLKLGSTFKSWPPTTEKIGSGSPPVMKVVALFLTTHQNMTWSGIAFLHLTRGNGIRT